MALALLFICHSAEIASGVVSGQLRPGPYKILYQCTRPLFRYASGSFFMVFESVKEFVAQDIKRNTVCRLRNVERFDHCFTELL